MISWIRRILLLGIIATFFATWYIFPEGNINGIELMDLEMDARTEAYFTELRLIAIFSAILFFTSIFGFVFTEKYVVGVIASAGVAVLLLHCKTVFFTDISGTASTGQYLIEGTGIGIVLLFVVTLLLISTYFFGLRKKSAKTNQGAMYKEAS